MRATRPVPVSRLVTGAVALARIPYADAKDYKVRPAVVVEADTRTVVVLPCTSAGSRFNCGRRYHELGDLESVGLDRPTGVRLTSVRLDRGEILKVCGKLGPADAAIVLAR
jgi:hypothetical protein